MLSVTDPREGDLPQIIPLLISPHHISLSYQFLYDSETGTYLSLNTKGPQQTQRLFACFLAYGAVLAVCETLGKRLLVRGGRSLGEVL